MKETALHNTSKKDVKDYPIAEAILDSDDNVKIDPDTQQPLITGTTHEWSLPAGETKIFPSYVADYLKSIYGFLEEVDSLKESVVDTEADKEKRKEPRKEGDPFRCKICGKDYKTMSGLGLHIAAKHPETLL